MRKKCRQRQLAATGLRFMESTASSAPSDEVSTESHPPALNRDDRAAAHQAALRGRALAETGFDLGAGCTYKSDRLGVYQVKARERDGPTSPRVV
jgi:hypothetical protein